MKKILTFIIFINCCLTAISCSKQNVPESPNQAYLYSSKSTIPKIQTQVFHFSADSSTIYIGVETSNLKYDTTAIAPITTIIKLLDTNELLRDSILNMFQIHQNQALEVAVLAQNIATKEGESYTLEVNILENSSKRLFKKTIMIDKTSKFGEQNFLLTTNELPNIIFNNYAPKGTIINVNYREKNQPLTVYHYPPSQQLASPPFILKTKGELYKADTTFTITDQLKLNKKGLYFIKSNKEVDLGKAILCVDEGFPRLIKAASLVETLRYITKSAEYSELLSSRNPKKAVDDFWLERAGSYKRGKILIQEFYGRIERANALFTTYKEGWKTDKGLIYIIYGLPQEAKNKNDTESWMYPATRYRPQLRFNFQRQAIGFAPNRAVLQRSFYFEDSWHRAVWEWRKGIIQNPN